MSARRFFVAGTHAVEETVAVADADAHKIRDVLRLRAGDEIDVIDSSGTVFRARLNRVDGRVDATLERPIELPADTDALTIDVAQGIPKGQKMDFVVEKLTALGVSTIIPFTSERAVVRDPGDAKLERWRRLAQTAAQQSGRRTIPAVADPLAFDDVLERYGRYDVVLFPWEVAAGGPALRETLPSLVTGARRVLVVVGPEGGFSHVEAERARDAGAQVISLGGRILRTETAALVVVTILQYLSS